MDQPNTRPQAASERGPQPDAQLAAYFVQDLEKELELPARGFQSRTLHADEHVKVILFRFSAASELKEHATPAAASLYFVQGEGTLTLGSEELVVRAGSFAQIPPHLAHSIQARTPMLALLVLGRKR